MTHCYKYKHTKGLWKLIVSKTKRFFFHVPIFFLMSFYFSEKALLSSKYTKTFGRFDRLCIPFFLWPIIIFYLNKLLIKLSITQNVLTIKDLRFQLIFGTGRMNMYTFWYQWDIIFITICYKIIIFIFRKKFNYVLTLITITSFLYQYNGKNFAFFRRYNYGGHYVFGRLAEMFPYSVIGFFISYSKIMTFFKKNRILVIISCIYISQHFLFYFLKFYKA